MMITSRALFVAILLVGRFATGISADEAPPLAPGNVAPLPRIIPEGPACRVKALAFSSDGKSLFAAGWDKAVYRWDFVNGVWTPRVDGTLAIPIGGGLDGAIEAMSVSADGEWLAVGGRGVKRGVASSQQSGIDMSAEFFSDEQRLDEGTIYLFHLPTGQVKLLRGHWGAVLGLRFQAQGGTGLVSVAEVWDKGTSHFQTELIAWDAAQATELGRLTGFTTSSGIQRRLPQWDQKTLPGLAPYRTNEDRLMVAVAIPWEDSAFGLRLWDVERKTTEALDAANDFVHFDVVVDPASPGDLLASSVHRKQETGQLRRWRGAARGEKSGSTLLHDFGRHQIPLSWSCRAVAGKTGGAVLVANMDTGAAALMRLEVSGERGQVDWTAPLKSNDIRMAVSDGTTAYFIAEEGSISLRRPSDDPAPQVNPELLSSPVASFREIDFAEKEGHPGLILRRVTPTERKEFLFDMSGRTLSSDIAGWKVDSTPESVAGTTITAKVGASGAIEADIALPSGKHRIVIAQDGETTPISPAFRLRLLNLDDGTPLLVAAYNHHSEPQLRVYDVKTGVLIRKYAAHTGSIRDMKLSRNGKLMATVAADGTVRLWWLGDLHDRVGRVGGLVEKGRALKLKGDEQERVVVTTPLGTLQAGDVLQTWNDGEGARPITSPKDCVYWAARRPPGTEVTLGTDRGERRFTLGQAVDWKRELVALSCGAMESAPGEWDWIAWHPSGAYDHRGKSVEKWLQWHFNTGDPAQPAKLARAKDYEAEFSRSDFLEPLLKTGQLPERKIVIVPEVSLFLANAKGEPVDEEQFGSPFVRSARDLDRVTVNIENEFPASVIRHVRWSLRDQKGAVLLQGEADKTEPKAWSFQPALSNWSPGFHVLTAELIVDGETHAVGSQSVDIRYQPEAPHVQLGDIPKATADASLRLPVTITAAVPGELQLMSKRFEKPITQKVDAGTQTIPIDIPLEMGFNELELIVSNTNALSRFESFEQYRQRFSVVRTEATPPVGQPELVSWQAQLPGEPPIDLRQVPDVLKVTRNRIEFTASIKALAQPQIEVAVNDHSAAAPLQGTGPYALSQGIDLRPGMNTVRLVAMGPTKEVLGTVEIDYGPPVPGLGGLAVRRQDLAGATISGVWPAESIVDGLHSSTVGLKCAYSGDAMAMTALVLLDGQPAPNVLVKIDGAQSELQAELAVPEGEHRVQFEIANARGDKSTTLPVSIRRIIPPRLLTLVNRPQEGVSHRTEMVFETPAGSLPVTPGLIRVNVNGKPISLTDRVEIRQVGGQTIADLSLPTEAGIMNTVEGWLERDDLPLLQRVSYEVDVPATIGQLPEIKLVAPSETTESSIRVELRIRSQSPITRLEIGTDAAKLTRIDRWELQGDLIEISKVALKQGLNTIHVYAENAAGPARSSISVTYTKAPVSFGQLKFIDSPEMTIDFQREDRHLGAVEDSVQKLEGILNLQDVSTDSQVQVWVNGFLQGTARLRPTAGGASHEFTADVILTRTQGNLVQLAFPGVTLATTFKNSFLVDCNHPTVEQELYLVIIDASQSAITLESDELDIAGKRLSKQLQDAIQATTDPVSKKLVSDAFQRINVEYILPWHRTSPSRVYGVLDTLQSKIGSQPSRHPVVLVYYRGTEVSLPEELREGTFGLTTWETDPDDPLNDPKKELLTENQLRKQLLKIGGAHLLILDLDPESSNRRVETGRANDDDPHLGVLRFIKNAPTKSLVQELEQALPDHGELVRLKGRMEANIRANKTGVPDFRIPLSLERLRLGAKLPE